MPPKAKFTKEEIVGAALDIVRESGMDGLTARALGYGIIAFVGAILLFLRQMKKH